MDEINVMTSKPVVTKKALFGVYFTVLILVAAVFSSFFWNASSQASELKTQNTNLQTQKTNLKNQQTELQNAIDNLQNQLDKTPQHIMELVNQINKLENQNNDLQTQIDELENEIPRLQNKVLNLTTANLVTALGIVEVPRDSLHNYPSPLLYNHLYISGSVTNTGSGKAYNAGLHVVAFAANGTEVVDLTVPLVNLYNRTGTEVTTFGPVFGTNAATQIYGNGSLTLGSLNGGQSVQISLAIFHEGVASRWTVTPVWTNLP
jgi:chaperonin cofactor prefoldin